MVYSLLSVFAPMLLGAQIILTMILVKGDICPGQRGRLHKVLPSIGVLWLAVASIKIEAFLVVFAIFYFYSRVQTTKTRNEGPLWVLYLVNGLSLAYVGVLISEAPSWSASLSLFMMIFLLGSVFANMLLSIARSRLDAFHRILPVVGILSAMTTTLCIVPFAYSLESEQLAELTMPLVISFSLLIAGIVFWSWHIITAKKPEKGQLAVAFLLVLLASTGFHSLYLIQ
ncbi:hypothetical protein HUO09_11325 [Vibrio sp. Y2-5]|uniref:hypothetical protein n=1 Tax=Vibrio TaxID=662 RepID=UPI00142DB0BB|nr:MULTISPECIES: hypothetical protein [Vibrio]MBD0786934.1 hypothetical protein [Vibrio sp. Y2-5]NIY94067.1 hypothetical protein [Vibrio diazotrophicus]